MATIRAQLPSNWILHRQRAVELGGAFKPYKIDAVIADAHTEQALAVIDAKYKKAFSKSDHEIRLAIAYAKQALATRFPWTLRARWANGCLRLHRVGPADMTYCQSSFDVFHWCDRDRRRIFQNGALTTASSRRPWHLQGPAGLVMRDLVDEYLSIEPRPISVETIESYIIDDAQTNPYGVVFTVREHLRGGKRIVPEPSEEGYAIAPGYRIAKIDDCVFASFA